MIKKFWNFIRDEDGERVLRLEGPIDEDNFWGDAVTPKAFRDELEAEDGNITVYICSPGGNVFAASEIYTMLVEYKGKVTVKIDAIAASAASVIAMAGDTVLMSPTALFMIHDPMTIAMGNTKDMEKAITTLNEVKESIINAYQFKSGLNRKKISQIMEEETWLNAKRAVELGFADGIITQKKQETKETSESEEKPNSEEKADDKEIEASWKPYSIKAMNQKVLNWLMPASNTSAVSDAVSEDRTKKPDSDDDDPDEREDDDPDEKDDDPDEKDDDPDKKDDDPDEESDSDEKKKPSDNIEHPSEHEDKLTIGMDGKTKDGAMPYELLRKQLEYLR